MTTPMTLRLASLSHPTRLRIAGAVAAMGLITSACATGAPQYVESEYTPASPPAASPTVLVAEPVDARAFTDASNRAPVPSVQGDPKDTALTTRVIGRRPATKRTLGSNVTLPEGQRVVDFVGQAVADGLRQAGVTATTAGATSGGGANALPRLAVTVRDFWLESRPRGEVAVIEYRFVIDVQGDWPRFRDGRTIESRGTVSSGGLNTVLWRRTFDRALEDIAKQTGLAAGASIE
jgi:hypothetical protein